MAQHQVRANLGFPGPVRVVANEPTVEEMDQLRDGEYVALTDGTICVRCCEVDRHQLYYVCPSCWTKRTKSGLPYKTARRVVHFHGSGGDFRVRGGEHRVMHCADTEFHGNGGRPSISHGIKDAYPGGVILYVTPSTKGAVSASLAQ